MAKETERLFKDFERFLAQKGITPENEEDLTKYLDEFVEHYNRTAIPQADFTDMKPTSAEDYMALAWEADTPEEALSYAKKALRLDKNNLDAEVMVADLTTDSGEALLKKYRSLLKKEEKRLAEEGLWDEESFGKYWLILETRPYMRLRDSYAELLAYLGKKRKSIAEYTDMLRLSENDNLGVRYRLMHLYAFYEDELSALRLYKKYDGYQDTLLLLPLITLYYRLDDYTNAKKYLKLLCSTNPEAEDFFVDYNEVLLKDILDEMAEFGTYTLDSVEEVVAALVEYTFLYDSTRGVLDWITETLKKTKKGKGRNK